MVVITSRGGDYSHGSPSAAFDYEEPYLRAIFGFCGLKDIIFVNAQPMDMDPEVGRKELEKAKEFARKVGAEW